MCLFYYIVEGYFCSLKNSSDVLEGKVHTEFDGFLCARPGEWGFCDAIHSEPPAILYGYH